MTLIDSDMYRGKQGRTSPGGAAGIRLRRVRVYHRAPFRELVAAALGGRECIRHGGEHWAPIEVRRGIGIYRRAPDPLACLQETVERYELILYGALLRGACGRDGMVRTRTHLVRRGDGALRPVGSRR